MSEQNVKVKEFLRENDYVTVVQKSGDGMTITYPHPKLTSSFPRLVTCFSFRRGDEPGFVGFTSHDNESQKERYVRLPEYAIRLYFIHELLACNSQIPIGLDMTVFLDEKGLELEDMTDVIQEPSDSIELEKEIMLHQLVIKARNDDFTAEYNDIAKLYNIEEGYSTIKKFYE